MSSQNQCFVNAMLKMWAGDKKWGSYFCALVGRFGNGRCFNRCYPRIYLILCFKRNISGDKGERFASPQSFRSLR